MISPKRMIKRWDMIIVVILMTLSFLPVVIFSYQQAGYHVEGDVVGIISSEGKVIQQVTLSGHEGVDTFELTDEQDPSKGNVIEIRDGRIRIKSATCPDQICVRTGFISRPGQTIVCIPHQLVIELQSERGQEDIIISS